ncbi:hypothetical protein [Mesorhizobium sp. M1136]|uniref:hypothetical protein n=1 Tax=unclassified Mesorhizobium TaxID=325217 RepID=UPI0033391CF5
MLLLRLQIQGMDQKSEPIAQALLRGPLALRNDAAIRYRMRNISAVVREFGAPALIDFSAAESVGSGVRPRIRAMLLENLDFGRLLNPEVRSLDEERQDALTALKILRDRIADLEQELSWIGHNNPPDTAAPEEIGRKHFRQALSDIDTIQRELKTRSPDKTSVEQSKSRLVRFATALATWAGERFTKFTDAALVAAAPVVVIKVFGLVPAIVDAVEAVTRTLVH